MRPPPPKLANCYVPLPLTSSVEVGDRTTFSSSPKKPSHALRRLRMETGTSSSSSTSSSSAKQVTGEEEAATRTAEGGYGAEALGGGRGSAWVEWGHTQVACHVRAPAVDDANAGDDRDGATVEEGSLQIDVQWACGMSNASAASWASSEIADGGGGGSAINAGKWVAWTSRREGKMRRHLRDALSSAIPLRQYAKCAVRVAVTVLRDDGGLLPACVLAATLALQDAAVELYDTVTCCQVAVVQRSDPKEAAAESVVLVADPDGSHEEEATATVTVAFLPSTKEVALWHQSGPLSPAVANDALDLCLDGCRTIHRFIQQHWRDAYDDA